MQTDLNDIIRAYRRNQLPPEEKKALEQRLSDDPAFAAEAAELATLQEALEAEGDQELEAKLLTYANESTETNSGTFSVETSKNNVRKMTPYSRIVYAAAVLVGLIVIALPFWLMNHTGSSVSGSPEEIYASNFSVPPLPEARGTETTAQDQWRISFANGDYESAISQLEILLADSTFTRKSEAYYYLGIANLSLENPTAALQALDQVREESFDWESAQWYTALAMLKDGQTDKARQLFEQISQQAKHPQQKQAKEILEVL